MNKNKLIAVKEDRKNELDRLKLCSEESYNSLLERILPNWAIMLRNKLEEEKPIETPLPLQNEGNN